MTSANRQSGNVGNLGDILKHAALVNLAKLLSSRNPDSNLNYLETHAFQLHAVCPNPTKWRVECQQEMSKHPVYKDYAGAEEKYIAVGQYRCSSGLIVDTLPRCSMYLCESDSATRQILTQQLAQAGVSPELILSDAIGLQYLCAAKNPGAFLALVDPFTLPDDVWDAFSVSCDAMRAPERDGIVLVFAWSKRGQVIWPTPPTGFVGPVMTLSRAPFFLAAYATNAILQEVGKTLKALGWAASG